MSVAGMERAGRRAKAGSLSGLSGGAASGTASGASVRRQRSLEWGGGERYSSSDDERPRAPPLADRVFASLLAQATQQFDNEQRRIYGSESGEMPRFVSSPQRQASPFPLESTNRRYYRRNRNSKGEESFKGDASAGVGGTMSRRSRHADEYSDGTRNVRIINGTTSSGGQGSERECESPPEPAPPEVPPRGPSLHVALRHRPDPPGEGDRLYLSEDFVMSEGGHGSYPARSPMSSSTTGHSSSSHHRYFLIPEGSRFGKVQTIVCIAKLLSHYRVTPSPNTPEAIKADPWRIVYAPKQGIYLNFDSRRIA